MAISYIHGMMVNYDMKFKLVIEKLHIIYGD